MSFRKASLAAMLAVSMVATPVLAQASVAVSGQSTAAAQSARAGAEMEDANELRGGWFIPLLAILAIIAGILVAVSDGGDRPTSP